jgi:hypothetical protein
MTATNNVKECKYWPMLGYVVIVTVGLPAVQQRNRFCGTINDAATSALLSPT